MKVQSFQDLFVWQKSMKLVELVYNLSKRFPQEELYALTNQIRRAVVSIPSNIAEGQGRNSSAQFIQFLSIAKGSNSEVQTQILISQRLNYVSNIDTKEILSLSTEIGKMLSGLISSLKK